MQVIKNQEFGGERPLYCAVDLRIEGVSIHAGESALKETRNIEAEGCTFEGKYPFWECKRASIKHCHFTEGARAALWYSRDFLMEDCIIDAPKMFREMKEIALRNVQMNNALETLWHCKDVNIDGLSVEHGDYILMHSKNIVTRDFKLNGNYSFQYCKNVEIRNSELHTKDAFWETEDVTVYDSIIDGEYLGWYSKNLHLINCHIAGTQPLCYAEGLVLENCTFAPDADLAFEYSSVQATIKGNITSVKNPRSGSIRADSIGQIIIDENIKQPANCKIITA